MIEAEEELCCPKCKYCGDYSEFAEKDDVAPKPELREYPKDREVEHDDMTTNERTFDKIGNKIVKPKNAKDWLEPR